METFKRFLMQENAYFVSPFGKVVPTGTNHIGAVIKNPQKFGLTRDEVVRTFEKYGERLGQEGKAREEIIRDLVEQGWLRIRKYKNQWSITANALSKKVKDHIYDWAEKMIKGREERDPYIPVKIVLLKNNRKLSHSMEELSKDVLYKEGEKDGERANVVFVESFDELPDLSKG